MYHLSFSAKILKIVKPVIAKPISELVNKSISLGKFPEKLKEAQVVPCYKKSNALDKSNYRPVSILPVISKFFERAIHAGLTLEGDSGEEVALWLLTSLCTSAKREVEVTL
jgi:hypothetical protein